MKIKIKRVAKVKLYLNKREEELGLVWEIEGSSAGSSKGTPRCDAVLVVAESSRNGGGGGGGCWLMMEEMIVGFGGETKIVVRV